MKMAFPSLSTKVMLDAFPMLGFRTLQRMKTLLNFLYKSVLKEEKPKYQELHGYPVLLENLTLVTIGSRPIFFAKRLYDPLS